MTSDKGLQQRLRSSDPSGPRPRAFDTAIVLGAVAMAAILWLVGDRSAASLLGSGMALAGAATVLVLGRDRPVLAVTIVFALASASRLVVETPFGTLRLDQPAIAALVIVAAVRIRNEGIHLPRAVWLIGVALVVYLGTLAIASFFVAPQAVASLRMTLWWCLSVAGGAAAFVLLRGRTVSGHDAYVSVGAAFAAVGIGAAILFAVAGPTFRLGIDDVGTVQPRVFGLGWEVNLYSSYLAAILLLSTGALGKRIWMIAGATALVGVAFPLGVTRGAYIGFVAGGLAMVAILAWRAREGTFRFSRSLASAISVVAISLVVGIASVGVLLPNLAERPSPAPQASATTQTPIGTAGATPSVAAPTPRPTIRPSDDTIGFRLARIGPALDDLRRSPLIGLGAASFGQRHPDPSQEGRPDHLAMLFLAVPYESGLIGSVALLSALLVILGGLIARTRGTRALMVASVIGAIVSILVSYQGTNAMHFATTWLLLGLGTAVAWDEGVGPQAEPG